MARLKKTEFPPWFSVYYPPTKPVEPPKPVPYTNTNQILEYVYDFLEREKLMAIPEWDLIELEVDKYDDPPTARILIKKAVKKPKSEAKIAREQNAYEKALAKYQKDLEVWEAKCLEWTSFKAKHDQEIKDHEILREKALLAKLQKKYPPKSTLDVQMYECLACGGSLWREDELIKGKCPNFCGKKPEKIS